MSDCGSCHGDCGSCNRKNGKFEKRCLYCINCVQEADGSYVCAANGDKEVDAHDVCHLWQPDYTMSCNRRNGQRILIVNPSSKGTPMGIFDTEPEQTEWRHLRKWCARNMLVSYVLDPDFGNFDTDGDGTLEVDAVFGSPAPNGVGSIRGLDGLQGLVFVSDLYDPGAILFVGPYNVTLENLSQLTPYVLRRAEAEDIQWLSERFPVEKVVN